jgi:hypothetical protein
MSESLVQSAVVEDCLHIMFASDNICAAFKEVGRGHINFAQFGSVTRSGDKFAVQLLDKYRDNWESHKKAPEEIGFRSAPAVPKSNAESILAFVLGWLCHRAANNQLKPGSSEASLYQDAFVFHRLYVNNNNTPAPYRTAELEKSIDSKPAAAVIDTKDVKELFSVMQQRFFVEMHTFVPDGDDIEGWFDKLDVTLSKRKAHMDSYAEAIMNPDPAKVKQYVTDTNFYNDEDAIIQLAQSIRSGAQPSQAEIAAALASTPKSDYGRALKQGLDYLQNASAFFTGSLDQNKLNGLLAV